MGSRYLKNIFETTASTSAKGDQIELSLDNPQTISNIVIEKDIVKEQRVRAYTIHVYTKGNWKIITQGESIGHKRIHQIKPTEVEQLKLEINKKIRPPNIERLSVY